MRLPSAFEKNEEETERNGKNGDKKLKNIVSAVIGSYL